MNVVIIIMDENVRIWTSTVLGMDWLGGMRRAMVRRRILMADVFGICATPSQKGYLGTYMNCADPKFPVAGGVSSSMLCINWLLLWFDIDR